ncbi:hypothetical protein [Streptomyces bohaiensis]
MDEEPTNPAAAQPRDAIDVDDLVFAATGRRVRRLTLPDGSHWFPAAELDVTESEVLASRGVPGDRRETLESLTGRFGVAAPAGPGWHRTTEMVDLSVVMMVALAGGGAGPDPFRVWVADVLTAVQRDGCHFLDEATVQPRGEEPGTGYAMPSRLAEAVVRLEEPSLPQDAAFAEDAPADAAARRPERSAGAGEAGAGVDSGADRSGDSAGDRADHRFGSVAGGPAGPAGTSAAGLVPGPRSTHGAGPSAGAGAGADTDTADTDTDAGADAGVEARAHRAGGRASRPSGPRPAGAGQSTGPGQGRRYDRRRTPRRTAGAAEPPADGADGERTEGLRDATGALRDLVAAQERSSRALARIAEALERFSGRTAAAEDPYCRTAGTPRVPFRGWSPAPLRHIAPPSTVPSHLRTAATAAPGSAAEVPEPTAARGGQLTPEARRLFTRWRTRLTVTDDIWTVARVLAEDLAAHGEARRSTAELARLCHLSERRVADSVLFLLRRNAIRKAGTAVDGTAVYVLSR